METGPKRRPPKSKARRPRRSRKEQGRGLGQNEAPAHRHNGNGPAAVRRLDFFRGKPQDRISLWRKVGFMLRTGLLVYLILSMLPGPWLCCCTLRHRAASPRQAVSAQPSQPISPGPRSCCYHHTAPTSRQTEGRAAPVQRPADPAPCPCRQRSSQPAVLPAADSSLTQQSLAAHAPTFGAAASDVLLPTAQPPGEAQPGPRFGADLPCQTGRDILRALHILRC
jgi:hypothetical protein